MVTICKNQFDTFLRQFVEISKETSEPWEILQAPTPNSEFIYASLTFTQTFDCVDNSLANCESDLDENDFILTELDDPQTVNLSTSQRVVRFQYHIIYNVAYSVPVLYFNAFTNSGSTLGLKDIFDIISIIYLNEDSFSSKVEQFEYYLSIISPIEHPYLGIPVYYIHPCQVSTLLSNVFTGNREQLTLKCNVIITWLSSIGPLIGLKLDPYYAVRLEQITPYLED